MQTREQLGLDHSNSYRLQRCTRLKNNQKPNTQPKFENLGFQTLTEPVFV
jgi:hypothetical protein